MNLDETVLRKLADWQPTRGVRQTLAVPDEGSGWAEGWAKGVAKRVTGLLEALWVLEIDAQRNEALLRSTEPSRRSAELFYYEVLLKGTQAANVCRYQASPGGGRREQVPFVLTHEALANFVRDLAAH